MRSKSYHVSFDEVIDWINEGEIAYLQIDNQIIRVAKNFGLSDFKDYFERDLLFHDLINGKWQLVSKEADFVMGIDKNLKDYAIENDMSFEFAYENRTAIRGSLHFGFFLCGRELSKELKTIANGFNALFTVVKEKG